MRTSTVLLVGAGPGDPGLLTVAGRAAIEDAQVLAYDSLVSEEIVALAPADALLIPVTRRGDCGAVPQPELADLLAQHAKAGLRVVRLKGGDPFVYGRGYEELAQLAGFGVPTRVIPGLTAALAAPACGGIPVICGEYAGSVHILSGNPRTGQMLALDYQALVRMGGTLVLLMALEHLADISAGLLKAGMPRETPVSILENGTLPTQRRINGTLIDLGEMRAVEPAVVVVGKVCGL